LVFILSSILFSILQSHELLEFICISIPIFILLLGFILLLFFITLLVYYYLVETKYITSFIKVIGSIWVQVYILFFILELILLSISKLSSIRELQYRQFSQLVYILLQLLFVGMVFILFSKLKLFSILLWSSQFIQSFIRELILLLRQFFILVQEFTLFFEHI
jgi:hypothetical protein